LIEGTRQKFRHFFSERRFFTAIRHAREITASFGNANVIPIRPDQARVLYESGATICALGIDNGDAQLAHFACSLKAQLNESGHMDFRAYLSPDRRGADIHYDSRIATIVQIAGAKRWWYSQSPGVRFPYANSNASYRHAWEQV